MAAHSERAEAVARVIASYRLGTLMTDPTGGAVSEESWRIALPLAEAIETICLPREAPK